MTIMVGRQRTSLDRAAINPGSEDAINMYGKEKEVKAAADQAWKQYLALPRDAGEDQLVATVAKEYDTTEQELDQLREATVRGDRDEILKRLFSAGKDHTNMQAGANALKTDQFNQTKAAEEAAESAHRRLPP